MRPLSIESGDLSLWFARAELKDSIERHVDGLLNSHFVSPASFPRRSIACCLFKSCSSSAPYCDAAVSSLLDLCVDRNFRFLADRSPSSSVRGDLDVTEEDARCINYIFLSKRHF